MKSFKSTDVDASAAAVTFYSTFLGSLGLCAAIHFLATSLSDDRSIPRLGLVILFFGCLSSATWSLLGPFERYLTGKLRWKYADVSPALRSRVDNLAYVVARFAARIGILATAASLLWGFAIIGGWPQFSMLASLQDALGWLALFAWLGLPLVALFSSGLLWQAYETFHQIAMDLRSEGGVVRDSIYKQKREHQAKAAPVEVTGPLSFRAGGQDWSWEDLYKNTVIFGKPGSGKTVCVLNALLDGLIASSSITEKPCAGLILDPKGDYLEKITALCLVHGREKDLVIIDPSNLQISAHWNPLDSSDDSLEVAGRFGAVMQIVSDTKTNDTFWNESAVLLFQHLISLYRVANPHHPPSLVDIYRAATSDDLLEKLGLSISEGVYESSYIARLAREYFHNIWVPMPDKTKATIRSTIANMLNSFNISPYNELFAGASDVTMANVLDRGLILYVNMPIAEREVMSRVICSFLKLEFYREVLKSKNLNKDRPSFFLCDEFQSFFTVGQNRGDADAFERTRQSNHANIIAFQTINTLLKQTSQREHVMSLLGVCATKLFLRNDDYETNQYASSLFGKHIENLGSSSVNVGRGLSAKGASVALSGSDQYQDRIKPDEFVSLVVPAKRDGVNYTESIALLGAGSVVKTEKLRWFVHPIIGGY